MKVLALDLSITSPGIIIASPRRVLVAANPKTGPKDGSDIERADYIACIICELLEQHPVDHIFVEEYAFSRRTNLSRLGELGGVVKYQAWQLGYDDDAWTKVSSSSVKLFATGNGRASKQQMVAAAAPYLRGFPPKIRKSDDVADALWLARWGLEAGW